MAASIPSRELSTILSPVELDGTERYRLILGGTTIKASELINALPAAVYITNAEGRVVQFNEACVRLSGRTPEVDCDQWCVSWKLYHPDGTPMPHADCPMAIALREGRAIKDAEIVVERPDGSRAWVLASPTPLFNDAGTLTGGINMLVDITARKRAEDSVRQSEDELADYFNTSSIGLHWVGPDGIILRANAAELKMLGYEENEYIGRHIADFHADQHVIEDILDKLGCGEQLHEYPARLRHKDGSIRDVLINSSVLFRDGEFIHTRCFTIDVTKRKRAEDSLRRSAKTFATLVEQSPLGIFTVDSQFRIAHISQGAMPAFRNVQPVIGRDFAEVMHTIWPEHFANEAIEIFRRVLETGEPYVSPGLTEQRKDIAQFESYEWQVNRITLADGRYGVVCYFYDTTRLQQAMKALRESEMRFRMLAENISQLAWTCENLCEMNWANLRWLSYTGLTLDESVGSGWQRVHHPDHINRVIEGKRRSQESGEIWEDTFPLRRHDGEYRWFLTRAVPIHDDDNNIIRWFGTNTDITERLEHEDQMRTVTAELNHRVKNTLAVIIAICQQTSRKASSLPEFADDFEARLHSIATAHGLLTSTEWKGCLLGDIVRSEMDAHVLHEGQLSIKMPTLVLVPGESLALHMVIHELTTNATKYGALRDEKGHIDFRGEVVSRDDVAHLHLSWHEHCHELIGAPGDNGFGSKLIDQSITYELNGEIRRDFQPSGLRCEIEFPLEQPKPITPLFDPPDQTHAPVPQRVLLVEDNAAIGMAMATEIEELGLCVLGPARTIEEAVQLIDREIPEVALLDVDLNGTKVYPLVYELRRRMLPYALMTGYSANDIPEDLRESKIFCKPIDLDEVKEYLLAHTTAG